MGTYTFAIREMEKEGDQYKEKKGGYQSTASNNAEGNFQFDLSYTLKQAKEQGEYYYEVTETAGTETGVVYDSSAYIVKVTV